MKKPRSRPCGKTARYLREIRDLQRSTQLLIPKLPFALLVREIARSFSADIRFQSLALEALQEAAEDFLIRLFQDTNHVTINGKHKTMQVGDQEVARRIAGTYTPKRDEA